MAASPTLPGWVPSTGRPSAADLNDLAAYPRKTVAGNNTAIPIVYGRDRLYGKIVEMYVIQSDYGANNVFVASYAFCEGPIDAFEAIFIDGVDITDPNNGFIKRPWKDGLTYTHTPPVIADVIAYTGTQTQPQNIWLTGSMPGTAHVVVIVPPGSAVGVPRVEAVIRGKKIYDPRKDSTQIALGGVGSHRLGSPTTWEWSDNPTLCFADFAVTYAKWGVHWASIVDGANFNDTLIGGEKSRTLGLTLGGPALVGNWVKAFRTYMGSFIARENGDVRVIPDRADVELPGAMQFPGYPDSGAVSGLAASYNVSDSFTVECWVYSGNVVAQAIIGDKASITSGQGWCLSFTAGGYIQVNLSDGTHEFSMQSVYAYNTYRFHHVAMVVRRVSNEVFLYIDGQLETFGSIATIGNMNNSGGILLGVGCLFDGLATQDQLIGIVDEVRIWAVARTEDEIYDNRYNEVSGTSPGLWSLWRFNDASGSLTAANAVAGKPAMTILVNPSLGGPSFVPGVAAVAPVGVARHFTADDIVKDSFQLTKRSMRQFPTVVQVEYTDSSYRSWRTEVQQAEDGRATAGLVSRRISKISLPGIHRGGQAKREAIERLNWFLSDLQCSFKVFDEGLELQQGSIVAVSHPIGLNTKLFRITEIGGQQGRWELSMAEYDPANYSNVVVETPSSPDSIFTNPLVIPVVDNVVAVEKLFRYREGTYGSRIEISWTPTNYPYLQQYQVEGLVDNEVKFQVLSPYPSAVSPAVEDAVIGANNSINPVTYEIRVYIQGPFSRGLAASGFVEVLGKLLPPGNVPSAMTWQKTSANGGVLTWQQAIDIDVWQYEVRTSTWNGTSWPTWEELAIYPPTARTDALNAQINGLALGRHRFLVRAIDSVKGVSLADGVSPEVVITLPPTPVGFEGAEVGGTVRLKWLAPDPSNFIARHRVAYQDGVEEVTEDVVDGLRASVPLLASGTWEFHLYSIDTAGRECATPAIIYVPVVSDAASYLVDFTDFYEAGAYPGMVTWSFRDFPATQSRFYVTSAGDVLTETSFADYEFQPLAIGHSNVETLWESPVHDFGLTLGGTWTLTKNVTALNGTVNVTVKLWEAATPGGEAGATEWPVDAPIATQAQFAKIVIRASGASTVLVITPIMRLRVTVAPKEEGGQDASVVGAGKRVTLLNTYFRAVDIQIQPFGTATGGLTGVVDNIVLGPGGGFDVWVFDNNDDAVYSQFFWKFKGV